jgi:type I restriction enzyme S subunit
VSFLQYPEYVATGCEWLPRVPSHWEVRRLGYFFAERREKASDKEWQPLSVTKEGIVPQLDTAAKTDDGDNRRLVRRGDFVINSRSDRMGSSGLSELDGSVSLISTVLQPLELVHGRFVHHLLRSVSFQQEYYRNGQGIVADLWTTRFGAMRDIVLAMPPVDEQRSIATFLDEEVFRLDALVAEQRRLMELLQEKRQAVIAHAVTKGLNANAPLKPSGSQWMGDIPEHWTAMPIRRAARLESGHTPSRQHPEYWVDCTVPWFSLADVWQIREAKAEYVYETKEKVSELGLANSAARLLPKGTVILSRTASVGFSAIMGVDMATTQDFANWVCGHRLLPEFLLYVLRAMQPEFRRLMMGSTHNTIYMPDIQALQFALPPLDEQQAIVAQVREITRQLDNLLAEVGQAEALLLERRAALISAAVTGQIDVRQLAAVEAA